MLFWQAQMAEQQAQTEKTKDWLTGIEQEDVELKTKVKKLEMYLNDSGPTSIKELQVSEPWKRQQQLLVFYYQLLIYRHIVNILLNLYSCF